MYVHATAHNAHSIRDPMEGIIAMKKANVKENAFLMVVYDDLGGEDPSRSV